MIVSVSIKCQFRKSMKVPATNKNSPEANSMLKKVAQKNCLYRQFFALNHTLQRSRIYCQQRSAVPDTQQAERPKIIFLERLYAPELSNVNAMTLLSIAARLLGKAATLRVSLIVQNLIQCGGMPVNSSGL